MALKRSQRTSQFATQINVNRGKLFDATIEQAQKNINIFNNAQKVFAQEFEKAEIKKGEKLASEATPIYSEMEVASPNGKTRKVKYVSGYNRPDAFNSSFAATKFDEEIAKQYIDQTISDVNSEIERMRAISISSNKVTDDIATVTDNFLRSVSPGIDAILQNVPNDVRNSVRAKTQNLITSATTEIQNNHISEAKTYNNYLAKSIADDNDADANSVLFDADGYLERLEERKTEMELLSAKESPMATFWNSNYYNKYKKLAESMKPLNKFFRFDVNNEDDIAESKQNFINLRQGASLGTGSLSLIDPSTGQTETINLQDLNIEGEIGNDFLQKIKTISGEQIAVLNKMQTDFDTFNTYKNLSNFVKSNKATYDLSTTDYNDIANALSDPNSKIFKDRLNEYNAKNPGQTFTANNVPADIVFQIGLEATAETNVIPSNFTRGFQSIYNAPSLDAQIQLFNDIRFQNVSAFTVETKSDATGITQYRKENMLDKIRDNDLRTSMKQLDDLVDRYGEAAGNEKFFDSKKEYRDFVAKGLDRKKIFETKGINSSRYKEYSPAKFNLEARKIVQSELRGFNIFDDIGISNDLINQMVASTDQRIFLGAEVSDYKNILKQEFLSIYKNMGYGKSVYGISVGGVTAKDPDELGNLDAQLVKYPIDDLYNTKPEVRNFIENKLNELSKIREMEEDMKDLQFGFGTNVFVKTLGRPNSAQDAVYKLVYRPDRNFPTEVKDIVNDDGVTITFTGSQLYDTFSKAK